MNTTSTQKLGNATRSSGFFVGLRLALACLFVLSLSVAAYAQKAVSGKVTDSGDNSALPGVSVSVKGTTTGTVTGADGAYRLNVPSDDATLVFSFVGYVSQEVAVGGRNTIDVRLASDVQALQEVVVVGYGEQKKSDITGAVAQVTSKDFNNGVINNPLQAVQGRVAGLVITTPNGDPNQTTPAIRLRGTSSLAAGSDPLIVIDGVIGAPLNSVAPEDIEKFDVLKDASAAAIYGSRGANGVIIITTKKGKAGRTTVDYNSYVGFESVAKFADVLTPDEFRQRARERNITIQDLGNNTNWFEEITRTAVSHNNSLSIGGGTDKSNYRASITYLNQPGVTLNSGFDRLNARLNVGQKALNDKLDVQLLVSANTSNRKFIQYDAFRSAFRANPTLPVYNEDGTFYQPSGFEIENPVARVSQLTDSRRDNQFLLNGKLFYEVVNGLRVGVNGSFSMYTENGTRFTPSAYTGFGNRLSTGERYSREVQDRLVEATVSYNKTFGGMHRVELLAGYTYQQLSNEGAFVRNRDFPDVFGADNLNVGEFNTDGTFLGEVRSNRSEARLDGLLGRVSYYYADKYLITANFRRDGSSRFGANNRYGFFPSVSVGWVISQEEFMKGVSFISNLKLRAGYGVTGNQEGIADYAPRQLYGPRGFFFSNGGYRRAYDFIQNANPDLQWETSAMTNVGIDFGFLQGRLNGSIEFYNKDTRDLLFNYGIAIGATYGSQNLTAVTPNILANVGQVNNRGVELAFDYLVIDKGDFQWRTNLNLAHNRNRVVSLSNDEFTFPADGIRYGGFGTGQGGLQPPAWLQEGYPIGQFQGAQFIGFDDQGRFQYRNAQGQIVNDASQAQLVPIGDAQPRLTLGWGNSIIFKAFDLSFFFRGSLGQKVANGPDIVFGNPTLFPNNNVLRSAFTDYRQITQSPQFSSFYVQDASFIRMDNFSLGYKLPFKSGGLVRSARVYVSGQNLFVITPYNGIDPELQAGAARDVYGTINNEQLGQNLAPGVNGISFYPRTRTFVVGVNFSF
ncbi:MAG: TonB-dependent receptor [Cytophagales bacterium]|nr:TonB-dependent receptor [Cytophagales bacterium]